MLERSKKKNPTSLDGKSRMDGADEISEVGKVTQRAKDVVVQSKIKATNAKND